MSGEKREEGTTNPREQSRSSPWVAWIAIGVGVFMVVVGGLLLLWGLSYQATVGEPSEINEETLVGGPALIPLGVVSIAFGSLWIHNGLKGFRKRSEEQGMKKCPHCGRKIEADLNFCYYCTRTFDDDMERDSKNISVRNRKYEDLEDDPDSEMTQGQRRRMERQKERKRLKEEKESKASSLEGLSR